MTNHKKITLGLLILTFTTAVNANGDSNDPPPSCITPCSAIPTVVCSSCPENKGDDKVADEVVQQVMKTYEVLGAQNTHSFEETMETLDTIMKAIAGLFVFITTLFGSLFGFWGVKNVIEIKKDINTAMTELKEEKQGIARLKDDIGTQKEDLTKQHHELKEAIELSKFTHKIIATTFGAYVKIVEYLSRSGEDIAKVDYALEKTKTIIDEYESKAESDRRKILKYADAEQLSWTYSIYGTAQHLKGNFPEAYKRLTQATELNPKSGDALFNLACVSTRLEKYEEAFQALEKAISINRALAATAWKDNDLPPLRGGSHLTRFKLICGEEPAPTTEQGL